MKHPFWSEGLRPFFLLGAAFAALSIPLWVFLVSGTIELPMRGGPLVWHIHEAIFGFVVAAIAGFLTTAVPQWTGRPPLRGPALMLLVLLWLTGRAAWLVSEVLPVWLVAALDVAFLPALCLALAAGIVQQRQWRNLPVLVMVLTLAAGNLLIHLSLAAVMVDGQTLGFHLSLFAVILLVTIIGGRIVPTFTRNALQKADRSGILFNNPTLNVACNAAVAMAGLLITFAPGYEVSGVAALVAAALSLVRLAGWRGWSAMAMPLVWVLHLGYLWLPVGFALYGAAILGIGVPAGAAIHALSVGAAATMILAVTTRASLGHTGRALIAPWPAVVAYLLLTVAAIARVAAAIEPDAFTPLLHASAACWCLAFLIFFTVYLPILSGRPQPASSL